MRFILLTAIVASLTACNSDNGAADAQLESLAFTSDVMSEMYDSTYVYTGDLSVSGADRDFALGVSDASGALLSASMHSPGALDLTVLDGHAGSVSIYPDWTGENAELVAITDESGLAYLANRGLSGGDLDTWFGADFATYGAALGTSRDANFNWTYHTILFQTDDGAVEIAPGDSDTLTLGGTLWQVVAIASYDRELRPSGVESDCGPPEDLISYEMVRVAARVSPATLTRLTGKSAAEGPGCGG